MEAKFKAVADGVKDDGEERQLCDNCRTTDFDKATLANRFCIKCEEKLCLPCAQTHEQKEDHLVVALNDQKEDQVSKEFDYCIEHHEELAEIYCACCRKIICSECQKTGHSSHSCTKVDDVADTVSKQAEAEFESLFDLQKHFDKEKERLISEKTTVIKTVKDMEDEIRKRCDEITEIVHNETKTLLKELDVFRKERQEEIEMEIRKLEEHAFTLKKFKEYCDQIRSNTNPRYTCEAEGILRNTVDDLKARCDARWKSGLLSVQLSIKKTGVEQVLKYIGKLRIKCPVKLNESCTVQLNEKQVYGMARLHDKLYVLSKSIFIHRLQHPFTSIGEIKTLGFKSPQYVVSCPKTSRLYIYDKDVDCIWKVAVPSHEVSRYLDKVKKPTSISVTSNAELLILRNNKPVSLEVCNEHAITVRRLKLPEIISTLQCIVESPCRTYIGLGETSVYKFRTNGSIVGEYSHNQGIPQCFQLSPYHVFLHYGHRRFHDYTYNVRSASRSSEKGTISSLSLDFESSQYLLHQYGDFKIPVNSCYIDGTKQLLVLEELCSFEDTTWFLSVYDVLPNEQKKFSQLLLGVLTCR